MTGEKAKALCQRSLGPASLSRVVASTFVRGQTAHSPVGILAKSWSFLRHNPVEVAAAICAAFEEQFGQTLSEEDLDEFLTLVRARGLVESAECGVRNAESAESDSLPVLNRRVQPSSPAATPHSALVPRAAVRSPGKWRVAVLAHPHAGPAHLGELLADVVQEGGRDGERHGAGRGRNHFFVDTVICFRHALDVSAVLLGGFFQQLRS